MQTIVGVVIGGAVAWGLTLAILHSKGAAAIARRVAQDGRRVVSIRPKWTRKLADHGLTPFSIVYLVTTTAEGGEAKAKVRLYAYDPGQWFSRGNEPLRLYSGGVWRNA